MINKRVYKQLLTETIVPEMLTGEDKVKDYYRLESYVNDNIPQKLYRYRRCNEYSIDAFYKDELWFSNGTSMNDDFDARLYYDKNVIRKWLEGSKNEDGVIKVIESIYTGQKILRGTDEIFGDVSQIGSFIRTLDYRQIQKLSSQFYADVNEALNTNMDRITKTVQGQAKFACFCERIDSPAMWGHYAESSTGFALEYDFSGKQTFTYNKEGQCEIYESLFPILYDNNRLDATTLALFLFQYDFMIAQMIKMGLPFNKQWVARILPCPDEFMPRKVALIKSKEWAYEKEWRLFYQLSKGYDSEQHSCIKYKPSAIYLGRNISDINQKILVDIAKEKDVPVYRMYIDERSRKYRLRCKNLN